MLIEIKQRRPAQLTILTVNAPGFRLKLMTDILIRLHIATGSGRNLRVTNFSVMLREFLQQRLIGLKTLRKPF